MKTATSIIVTLLIITLIGCTPKSDKPGSKAKCTAFTETAWSYNETEVVLVEHPDGSFIYISNLVDVDLSIQCSYQEKLEATKGFAFSEDVAIGVKLGLETSIKFTALVQSKASDAVFRQAIVDYAKSIDGHPAYSRLTRNTKQILSSAGNETVSVESLRTNMVKELEIAQHHMVKAYKSNLGRK